MFSSFVRLAGAMAAVLTVGLAHANSVVDTGTPPETLGWSFSNSQYFAGEFQLTSDSILDSIQGYFSTEPGAVDISIHANSGDVPGAILYTASLATSSAATDWNGLSNLDWSLGAGTYWVSFKPTFAASNFSSMPGAAPNPLTNYALGTGDYSWTNEGAILAVGVRIDDTVAAPVPEPATITMYAVGLLCLGVVGHRKLRS